MFSLRTLTTIAVTFSLLSGLAACGGDAGEADREDRPATRSAEIGPGGGTLISTDGRVALEFPAGALGSPVTITITAKDPSAADPLPAEFVNLNPDAVYALEPSGTVFDTPVTVTLSDPALAVAGATGPSIQNALVAVFLNSDQGFELLENLRTGLSDDRTRMLTRGEIRHFSDLVVRRAGDFTLQAPKSARLSEEFPVTATLTLFSGSRLETDPMYPLSDIVAEFVRSPGEITMSVTRFLPDLLGRTGPVVLEFETTFTCLPQPGTVNIGLLFKWRIQGGQFESSLHMDVLTAEVDCVSEEPRTLYTPGPVQLPAGFLPEALALIRGPFAQFDAASAAALMVCGLEVCRLLDPFSYLLLHTTPVFATGVTVYGALAVTTNPEALVLVSSGGAVIQDYVESLDAFSPALLGIDVVTRRNMTDATPIGGMQQTAGVTLVDHTASSLRYVLHDTAQAAFREEPSRELSGSEFPALPGSLISAYTHTADGPVLAVADGTPGALYLHPRGTATGATRIGDLGDSPRRIRCLIPICAVSNFGSDSLTLLTWNGGPEAPVIVGTIAVGDGPVGIDLTRTGANIAVLSTGFNDHSFSISVVDPAGTMVSMARTDISSDCLGPGHGIFVEDAEGIKVVVSCNLNDRLLVTDVVLP